MALGVYVRGYSLAGERQSGSSVKLDGKAISTVKFLLTGPYLSWSGFLCILRDFSIAPVSLKSIMKEKQLSTTLARFLSSRNASSSSPPLLLKEAAALFIEASRSGNPTLTLGKYVDEYREIYSGLTKDPWDHVYEWLLKEEDWDIKAGINFMQFIDCIGVSDSILHCFS